MPARPPTAISGGRLGATAPSHGRRPILPIRSGRLSPRDDAMTSGRAEGHSQSDRAFFGRRKGKTLRRHQAELMADTLPAIRLDLSKPCPAPRQLFGSAGDVHIEVGFGGGEHLALRASESPDIGFIGCEVFVNGVAKMLAQVERFGLGNVRVCDDDAKHLLAWLPDASIGRAYILYPDPWP